MSRPRCNALELKERQPYTVYAWRQAQKCVAPHKTKRLLFLINKTGLRRTDAALPPTWPSHTSLVNSNAPPRWMTTRLVPHGLEWLGRFLIEPPRRLWKRYIIGNPLFLWRVLKQRLGLLHFDET